MIKAVIFDWDGTLGMTLHLWLEGYRNELQKLGFNFSDKVIVDDFFYEHDKATIKYPSFDFSIFVQDVYKYMKTHVSSLKTYAGTIEMLEKLQADGITLTLVSSSPRKLLKEALEQTKLEKFFSAIVAGDDVMKHKPDPEPFLNVIEIAKLDIKTTIILGDSRNDIIAAHAAGIRSCLFLPPENKIFYDYNELKKTKPTYCAESLEEFTKIITNET